MMSGKFPLIHQLTADVPAAGTAGGVVQMIGEAPFDGTVTSVSFTPSANVIGNDSNYVTLKIVNRGQAGAGTLVAASQALTVAGAGGTLIAGDEKALTIDTARDDVTEGDVLEVTSTPSGGGLVVASGYLQLEVTRS